MKKKKRSKPVRKKQRDKQVSKRDSRGRFKPGFSGNPDGRPPGTTFTDILKEEIEKVCPGDPQKRTWRELIVFATMKLAIKGNATALREVWERIDGRVREIQQDPNPQQIKVVLSDLYMPQIKKPEGEGEVEG